LTIKNSGLFDPEFYLQSNPGVRASGINPIIHYIKRGWKENKDPGPGFSTSWYLKTYQDVKEGGINPLYHYIKFGIKEGRQIKKLPKTREGNKSIRGDHRVDFLIIGAQRAGTTSLFKYIDLFPQFCGAREKEVGFFSIDDHYTLGADWYHQQFDLCLPGQLRFEATPEYLYYPFVPERVKKYYDGIKLIVILRNPIERCYSAWKLFKNIHRQNNHRKNNIIDAARTPEKDNLSKLLLSKNYPSFSNAVIQDIERYYADSKTLEPSFVRRGIYHQQIWHWMHYFEKSNFLFFEINDLTQPHKLISKLANFLSIDFDTDSIDVKMQQYNQLSMGDFSDINKDTLNLLKEFYYQHNIKLFELINQEYDWTI
jgi:hypothetical protein